MCTAIDVNAHCFNEIQVVKGSIVVLLSHLVAMVRDQMPASIEKVDMLLMADERSDASLN